MAASAHCQGGPSAVRSRPGCGFKLPERDFQEEKRGSKISSYNITMDVASLIETLPERPDSLDEAYELIVTL